MTRARPALCSPPFVLERLQIAACLREIAALLRLESGNRFKAGAYERAASALEALATEGEQLADADWLRSIPGIGEVTARTIATLRSHGTTPLLERLRAATPKGVLQLRQVPHLTRRRLETLQRELGIADVDALEARCRDGSVRKVKGFGDVVVARLLAGIAAWRERGTELLLNVADDQANTLLAHVRALPDVRAAELAGACRRRLEIVDAIDVVVATRHTAQTIDRCVDYPPVIAVTDRTTNACTLRLASGAVARVWAVRPACFAEELLLRTGPAAHVAPVLERAGRTRAARSEDTIYARAGLAFVPAELRDDGSELAAAAARRLPRLVRAADVRGLVHCHTLYSDGRHSIEAMARAADALGMEYLTITDHSPAAHYANGLTVDRLRAQWEEIARVQELVAVRLLRGTECDILADGQLDHDDRVLEQLDVVIASVHNRHRLDREAMTRRLVAAMRHPLFKIWGHPLGRFVRSRPPIDCDVLAVLDAAAESRVAIEVNGDPHRLDLAPEWQREASARGIPFVVSTDAHSTRQFANLAYGIDMARRGWLTAAQILNCRSAEAFAAAVRPA